MDPIESVIRKKLEDTDQEVTLTRFGWDNPKYDLLEEPVRNVISAYQNANRWLDTIKEHILIELDCSYLSYIVHQLAHMMPGRFDKFGDILHTENLTVPYPTTKEWSKSSGDLNNCINHIYDILESIRKSLFEFKEVADSSDFRSMSIACDELILEVSNDFNYFYRIEGMLKHYTNNIPEWDKRCFELYKELPNIK